MPTGSDDTTSGDAPSTESLRGFGSALGLFGLVDSFVEALARDELCCVHVVVTRKVNPVLRPVLTSTESHVNARPEGDFACVGDGHPDSAGNVDEEVNPGVLEAAVLGPLFNDVFVHDSVDSSAAASRPRGTPRAPVLGAATSCRSRFHSVMSAASVSSIHVSDGSSEPLSGIGDATHWTGDGGMESRISP